MKKFLFQFILIADKQPSLSEKISYTFSVITAFAPVAYVMNGLGFWFKNNQQFSSFILVCLAVNLIVGIWFHNKMNTFSWHELYTKNIRMWTVLIIVYGLLEMLRLTAGDNFIGEGFKILIQVMTLMFPISKVLKNIYILSQKQFPPAFIMDRVYNFEKTGNMNDLFNADKKQE